MPKHAIPVFFCSALVFAGLLIVADLAVADFTSCFVSCISLGKECKEKVKDSPNDIERELCDKDMIECQSKCREEDRRDQEQKKKEQEEKEQEEKATLDSQGYTHEDQVKMKLERKRLEKERLDEEEREQEEREEEERLRKADEDSERNKAH